MSGHSKWSTIKHKKAAADAKRGKIFTRLAKDLTLAAREGGGEIEFNNALALAVDKAKAANMPKDNIERAIKRGTGELEGAELIEILYEAYAPHGVGMIIEAITDNRNRAIADVRHVVNKYQGNMAESGSVAWQFTRKGYIKVVQEVDEDEFFMLVAEAGAEDLEFTEEGAEIYVELDVFKDVQDAIRAAGIKIDDASMIYDPNNAIALETQQAMQVMTLIEKLEDVDDVQNVYSALDLTDEVMAELEAAG